MAGHHPDTLSACGITFDVNNKVYAGKSQNPSIHKGIKIRSPIPKVPTATTAVIAAATQVTTTPKMLNTRARPSDVKNPPRTSIPPIMGKMK